jgi:hypothetical protein
MVRWSRGPATAPEVFPMRRILSEEVMLSVIGLLLAGVSPNVFPAAQAGIAKMSDLAVTLLLPSVFLLCTLVTVAAWRRQRRLANRVLAGAAAGLVATLALEAVRITGFSLGWMPGDLPRLMGVLLTDRFMLGPSTLSDILGWAYHFWNGVCFGIIFAVLFGRRSLLWAVAYAELIAAGFLLSPVVKSFGIGVMGSDMPSMPATVALAHLAYGLVLGLLIRRWIEQPGWLLGLPPGRAHCAAEASPSACRVGLSPEPAPGSHEAPGSNGCHRGCALETKPRDAGIGQQTHPRTDCRVV